MKRVLITGGAGFIGSNTAAHFLAEGAAVTVFDSFHRRGARSNVEWLQQRFGSRLQVVVGDVRRAGGDLATAVASADVVVHLAAQVAVTTSVVDPRDDFEVNALGTFNVLEAARTSAHPPILLYASTNKVYGKMADAGIVQRDGRYEYEDLTDGADEARQLDFYSPYGCSKGTGDQYVIDYARIYGLRTVTFRQSCIYGPRQFGHEDQGWIAWFALRARQQQPVVIFGDGRQVRDALYVEDLVRCYAAAIDRIEHTAGQVYNVGGGPENTLSLLELVAILEQHTGHPLVHTFEDWRPGDQRVFIADIRRATRELGWSPTIRPADGISRLLHWIDANRALFA